MAPPPIAGGKSPTHELTQCPTNFAALGLQLMEAVKEAASHVESESSALES
jgi:hypothetical protein